MTTLLIALQTVAGIAWGYAGAAIGAGLSAIGAGIGIGKIGQGAMEGMARQPEAALVEGVAFFAVVICLLIAIKS